MFKRIVALALILMLGACAVAEVASGDETVEAQEVVEEGMVPIGGEMIRDGVYPVEVRSSSSMFKIVSCTLEVQNGEMRATMTMSGTGYLKLFMGTGAEAVSASEADCIPFEEDAEGVHSFTVPVPALDAPVDCAAFSKRKEKWYDRRLLFRADSLPLEAFREGALTTVAALGLEDGLYSVDARLVGDAGKAKVESPAQLRVENGEAFATVVWGSKKYADMSLCGARAAALEGEGNAAFEARVPCFDWNLAVTIDSTALGAPVEMAYSLRFDSASIAPAQ